MGHGTGGRGSFVPERRGRSLGRHPENGDSGREELTPYQELATEVGRFDGRYVIYDTFREAHGPERKDYR